MKNIPFTPAPTYRTVTLPADPEKIAAFLGRMNEVTLAPEGAHLRVEFLGVVDQVAGQLGISSAVLCDALGLVSA